MPMKTRDSQPKRIVRYFISYTRLDEQYPDQLLGELQKQFGACARYDFHSWRATEILPGEDWHKEIQTALDACHFGLLLVSPAFLNRNYIKHEELPRFVTGTKPCIPAMLCSVDHGSQDLCGLDARQIFGYTTPRNKQARSFQDCTSAKNRTAFAQQLYKTIIKRLDKLFEDPTPTPDSHGPRTSIPHNLPTLQPFFGREQELRKIADALDSNSRTWGALIDRPAGMGKTSLAVRAQLWRATPRLPGPLDISVQPACASIQGPTATRQRCNNSVWRRASSSGLAWARSARASATRLTPVSAIA